MTYQKKELKFSPYTLPLVEEALARGIEVSQIIDNDPSYALLQYRGHKEIICQSKTNLTGAVTFQMLFNKSSCLSLLENLGYPVSAAVLAYDQKTAEKWLKKWKRLVIKPNSNSAGAGISVGIANKKDLSKAISLVKKKKGGSPVPGFVIQRELTGKDYRVLVIDYCHTFVAQRIVPILKGDGISTVAELIKKRNTYYKSQHPVVTDDYSLEFLQSQGYKLDSIPPKNELVKLTNVVSVHKGAKVIELSNSLTNEMKDYYTQLAKALGARILGIDVMSSDINLDKGKILEVNPHPDISIHMNPHEGIPQNPSQHIIDLLFPETVSHI